MKRLALFTALMFCASFSLALAQGTNLNTGGSNLPSSPTAPNIVPNAAPVNNADGGTNLNRGGTNLNPAYTFEVKNPLKCPDLQCILGGIIRLLVYRIAPAIVTFMVIVGAFQILTAAGNPEKFKKGRQTILYAAIGFAIVLLAGSVGALIQSFLNDGGAVGPSGASGSIGDNPLAPFEYNTDLSSEFDYTAPAWTGRNPLENTANYGYNPYQDLSGGDGSGSVGGTGGSGSYSGGTQGCSYYINPQDYCIQTGGSDCGRISKDGPPICVSNGTCSNSVNPQEYCRRTGGVNCSAISPDGPRVCLN